MSDNLLDQIPEHDRLSIPAVLVSDGQEPTEALLRAGILDPIAIPVVVGDEDNVSGGILGDGITANFMAVLETAPQDDFDLFSDAHMPPHQPDQTRQQADDTSLPRTNTVRLPSAYGLQPLAPVRARGG